MTSHKQEAQVWASLPESQSQQEVEEETKKDRDSINNDWTNHDSTLNSTASVVQTGETKPSLPHISTAIICSNK